MEYRFHTITLGEKVEDSLHKSTEKSIECAIKLALSLSSTFPSEEFKRIKSVLEIINDKFEIYKDAFNDVLKDNQIIKIG
jgi:hypothetical protein